MNSNEIRKCIKEIYIKLVMPLKSSNCLYQYDKPLEKIGEALRQLYHKVDDTKDPWAMTPLFNKNNEIDCDDYDKSKIKVGTER